MEEPTLLIEKSRGSFPGGVVYLSHVIHIMGMGFHSVPQRHELHLVFLLLQSRSDWKSNSKRYMWVHGPWSPPDRCHLKLNFYRMISFIDYDRKSILIDVTIIFFIDSYWYRLRTIDIDYRLSINYLIITYFRETSFSRFKKFREIEVPRKKGAAKIKDTKFSDLYKNLYLSFPSARSLHTSRRAKILV